jgi:hypothetical protein
MDFDRAAILAEASALLGYPATRSDFLCGNIPMTLRVMSAGNSFNHSAVYYPAYFTSTTAWTREDHAAYNFVDGTENGDGGDWTLWNGGVNDSGLGLLPRNNGAPTRTIMDVPTYYAPGSGEVWAAPDNAYQDFDYPPQILADYLFSPLNAYLTLVGDGINGMNNGYCYSKEGVGPYGQDYYVGPTLSFIVPEPTTLAVLLFAGLPVLRRRPTSWSSCTSR